MSSSKFHRFLVLSFLIGLFPFAVSADDEGPIRVGILHSLSGTMAISESRLKDLMLMLIEEQNQAGGLLGRQIVAVIADPASDEDVFAEQARDEGIQGWRDRTIPGARRDRGRVQVLGDHGEWIVGHEG